MPPCFLGVMRGLPFFLAWCVLGQTAVVVDVGMREGSDFSAVPGYAVLAVWNDSVREADPPPAVSPTPSPAVSPTPSPAVPPTPPPGGTPPPVGPPDTSLPEWVIFLVCAVVVALMAIAWWMRHRGAVVHEAQGPRPQHSIKVKMTPIHRR